MEFGKFPWEDVDRVIVTFTADFHFFLPGLYPRIYRLYGISEGLFFHFFRIYIYTSFRDFGNLPLYLPVRKQNLPSPRPRYGEADRNVKYTLVIFYIPKKDNCV